ncbi:MAG: class I SAM-dependent methyltransferase [Immundisolibacter sp.]
MAVLATAGDRRPVDLARRLALPLIQDAAGAALVLAYGAQGLELRAPGRRLKPLRVDFAQIGQHGGGALLRAARVRNRPACVLDLTAGLATDAFRLARAGFEVIACEREPVIHALVEEALGRAPALPGPGRLQLRRVDARVALADPALPMPDVIYLDPMFPGEGRTALPRRELQLLREVTGEDGSGAELLALARSRSKRRVVVKRPLHAPALAPDADLVFKGRAVRFDVYLTGAAAPGCRAVARRGR